jgi:hypothetical protein
MDRQAFEHLYLHANSMATLGMLRAMVRLAAMPAPTEPTPEMLEFVAGIEHDLAHPESFDWSIHDEIDNELKALEQQRDEQALASNLPFFDQCVDMAAPDEVEGEMPDIARYLERALAARDVLAPRIDDSFARVDRQLLAAAFATLPAELPPLTGPLTAGELERWIELYEANDDRVMKVVEETRRHEPMP